MPRQERTPTRRPGQLPPGRHKLPREIVEESQRTRILDGIVAAVADHGYGETRLADVIATAGVSRKTFYEYFRDLEDAFLAAYDLHVAALTDAVSAAFLGSDGDAARRRWTDQIRDGVRAFVGYLAEHPDAAKVCMVDALGAGKEARGRRDAALRSFTFFIDSGRGEAAHEVPGRTALAVLGGANELIAWELLHGSPAKLRQLAPEVVYMIVLPFLGPKKALTEREKVVRELAAPKGREQARRAPASAPAVTRASSGGKERPPAKKAGSPRGRRRAG